MATPDLATAAWTCPSCERLVPGRIRQCRCGADAPLPYEVVPADAQGSDAAAGSIAGAPARSQSWLWIAPLLLIAGGAAGVYFARSEPEPAVIEDHTSALPAIGSGDMPGPAGATRLETGAPPISRAGELALRSAPISPLAEVSSAVPPASPIAAPIATPPAIAPALEDIVGRASAAVVSIETPTARGTGFFVTQDLVLTNAHVIAGHSFVTVRLHGGAIVQGRVERSSTDLDLAVIRAMAKAESTQILQLGSASAVRPGQEVLAIGSPMGLQNTVTRGIVSALRESGGVQLIQTDAAINPGNSGGPLLDRQGRVIGITTLKMSRGAESLGFAVAIAHAVPLIEGRSVASGAGTPQAPSLSAAASGGASQVDAQRRAGEQQFERAMQQLAQRGDEVDSRWRRLNAECPLNLQSNDGQREWFATRDQPPTFKTQDASCSQFLSDIRAYVAQFSKVMAQVGEDARRAGVYPGTLRDTRRRYRLDWSGWDR
jgi:hypothetical protein